MNNDGLVAKRKGWRLQISERRFNSARVLHAGVARLEERRFRKPQVIGSSPITGSSRKVPPVAGQSVLKTDADAAQTRVGSIPTPSAMHA